LTCGLDRSNFAFAISNILRLYYRRY